MKKLFILLSLISLFSCNKIDYKQECQTTYDNIIQIDNTYKEKVDNQIYVSDEEWETYSLLRDQQLEVYDKYNCDKVLGL